MIIDIICDEIIGSQEFNLDEWKNDAWHWGYELPSIDPNFDENDIDEFTLSVRNLYGVLTAEVLNLWEFKMACLDYMEKAEYRGCKAWHMFNNMSLAEIGKKMDGIAVVER